MRGISVSTNQGLQLSIKDEYGNIPSLFKLVFSIDRADVYYINID